MKSAKQVKTNAIPIPPRLQELESRLRGIEKKDKEFVLETTRSWTEQGRNAKEIADYLLIDPSEVEAIRAKIWPPKQVPLKQQTPTIPAPIPKGVSYILTLDEFQDGKMIHAAEVELTPAQLEKLRINCEVLKCDFSALLARGLNRMTEDFSPFELDNAVAQSKAMTTLLLEAIEKSDGQSCFNNRTDSGENMLVGLMELVWQTQSRLEKALEVVS